MEIIKITKDKKKYLDLLLLGDEQEDMVDKYLSDGEMFVASAEGKVQGECVITYNGNGEYEIKNVAVYPEFQRHGVGRKLLNFSLEYAKGKGGKSLIVGTGEAFSTMNFYMGCGFTEYRREKDFFTKNYNKPIYEDGVQLKDMVYFKKDI